MMMYWRSKTFFVSFSFLLLFFLSSIVFIQSCLLPYWNWISWECRENNNNNLLGRTWSSLRHKKKRERDRGEREKKRLHHLLILYSNIKFQFDIFFYWWVECQITIKQRTLSNDEQKVQVTTTTTTITNKLSSSVIELQTIIIIKYLFIALLRCIAQG